MEDDGRFQRFLKKWWPPKFGEDDEAIFLFVNMFQMPVFQTNPPPEKKCSPRFETRMGLFQVAGLKKPMTMMILWVIYAGYTVTVYPPARIPVTNEGLGWDSLLKM